MKTSIKTLQDVGSLHDLRTYTGAVKKSGKPDLPTTAILNLYMRRSERERVLKELKRLKRRKAQLQKRLGNIEKEMTKLLEKATKTASELSGASQESKESNPTSDLGRKGKTVLEY